MNKVVTINLHGVAFHLEEAGYEALRVYLDGAARRLAGNPDRDEIIADIEQAIADKCRAVLGPYKTVVGGPEIAQIIDEMGPVEDASAETEERQQTAGAAAGKPGSESSPPPPPVRRLYKIPDGAMFAGVCNGLAAYFAIDVTVVRIAFALLTVVTAGVGFLAYGLLMILVPSAETTGERAAAYGAPSTAQEFIHRAREGYYEGMRTLADKHAHREWRRRFKREMHDWGRMFQHEVRVGALRWQRRWGGPGMPGPVVPSGMWIILPFLAVLRAVLAVIAIFAVVSLITTGAVFGLALPAGVPVWVGVIGLIVLYGITTSPLKALRHAWYYHAAGGPHFAPPLFWFGDTIIALGALGVLLWVVDHHVPQAHEALRQLPAALHQAADTVKAWWTSR
jgi:phage shock protein PspC (stress-responsive transcriptional regulator)